MFGAWVTTNVSQRISGPLVHLHVPVTFNLSQLGGRPCSRIQLAIAGAGDYNPFPPAMSAPEQTLSQTATGAGWFKTTHWSVVLDARRNDSPQASAALARLCQTSCIRFTPTFDDWAPEDAKDLTQEFFFRLAERSVTNGPSVPDYLSQLVWVVSLDRCSANGPARRMTPLKLASTPLAVEQRLQPCAGSAVADRVVQQVNGLAFLFVELIEQTLVAQIE